MRSHPLARDAVSEGFGLIPERMRTELFFFPDKICWGRIVLNKQEESVAELLGFFP